MHATYAGAKYARTEEVLDMALGFLGSAISAGVNSLEARRSRNFQEDMRATQYQVAMADMRQAGLNPMLAGQVGGSTTSSAAQARVAIGGGEGVKDVLGAKKVRLEKEVLAAQATKAQQDTRVGVAQQMLVQGQEREQIMKNSMRQLENDKIKQYMAFDRTEAGKLSIAAGRGWMNSQGAANAATSLLKNWRPGR